MVKEIKISRPRSWRRETFYLFTFSLFNFLTFEFLKFPASEPAGSRNPSETQGIIRDSAKLGFHGIHGLRGAPRARPRSGGLK